MDFIEQQPESGLKRFLRENQFPLIIGGGALVLAVVIVAVVVARRGGGEEMAPAAVSPTGAASPSPAARTAAPPKALIGRVKLKPDEREALGIPKDAQAQWVEYPGGFRSLDVTFPGGPAPERDTDGDGLSDAREKELRTNPLKTDTDGDGLSDVLEVNVFKTNPTKADTDGDGKSDAEEIKNKTNPLQK